jgi:hypothetical protein
MFTLFKIKNKNKLKNLKRNEENFKNIKLDIINGNKLTKEQINFIEQELDLDQKQEIIVLYNTILSTFIELFIYND